MPRRCDDHISFILFMYYNSHCQSLLTLKFHGRSDDVFCLGFYPILRREHERALYTQIRVQSFIRVATIFAPFVFITRFSLLLICEEMKHTSF